MKARIQFLFIAIIIVTGFTTKSFSQTEVKAECFNRADGTQSCSAPEETDPMKRFHLPDNTGTAPSGSAKPYVSIPNQGNSNNGCSFCNPDYDLKTSDKYLNAQPGITNTGSGDASDPNTER